MAKTKTTEPSMHSDGAFTHIAHLAAWAITLVGSLGGAIMVALSVIYAQSYGVILGFGIVLSSWVGAATLGTLAEISMKLSRPSGE